MKKQEPTDFIFVEHVRKDVFTYLVSLPDREGREHDLEVRIIFAEGELEEVQPPFGVQAKDTELKEYWRMQGQIAQMIENASRQVKTGRYEPGTLEISGDTGAVFEAEIVEREEVVSETRGLTEEGVIELRRKFRDRRHRNLVLGSEARRYHVTGQSVSNALLGKTWAHVTEEPPLTAAEYDRALAQPLPSRRIYSLEQGEQE